MRKCFNIFFVNFRQEDIDIVISKKRGIYVHEIITCFVPYPIDKNPILRYNIIYAQNVTE